MTAHVSSAMIKAISLIRDGITAYRAAQITGLKRSSIYRSRLYKELVKSNKCIENGK